MCGGSESRFTVDGLLTKGRAAVTTGPESAGGGPFAQCDFKWPLHAAAGADARLCPVVQRHGETVRLLLTSDPCRARSPALRRRVLEAQGPLMETSPVKTSVVTTVNPVSMQESKIRI